MKSMCDELGLRQTVRAPIRNEYLLDLYFTDMHNAKVSIEPSIADHKALRLRMPIRSEEHITVEKVIWHYKGVTWHALKHELSHWNWQI